MVIFGTWNDDFNCPVIAELSWQGYLIHSFLAAHDDHPGFASGDDGVVVAAL